MTDFGSQSLEIDVRAEMSEGADRRVVHLVLIDGRQAQAAAAAEDLILGLRPLLAQLLREGRLLKAAFGGSLRFEGEERRSALKFEAVDSFTHVVQLEFASLDHLEWYYRAALHSELRVAFYRRLPDLAGLWTEYDAAPPEHHEEIFVRIDRQAAQLYIRRIDYLTVARLDMRIDS